MASGLDDLRSLATALPSPVCAFDANQRQSFDMAGNCDLKSAKSRSHLFPVLKALPKKIREEFRDNCREVREEIQAEQAEQAEAGSGEQAPFRPLLRPTPYSRPAQVEARSARRARRKDWGVPSISSPRAEVLCSHLGQACTLTPQNKLNMSKSPQTQLVEFADFDTRLRQMMQRLDSPMVELLTSPLPAQLMPGLEAIDAPSGDPGTGTFSQPLHGLGSYPEQESPGKTKCQKSYKIRRELECAEGEERERLKMLEEERNEMLEEERMKMLGDDRLRKMEEERITMLVEDRFRKMEESWNTLVKNTW